MASQRSAAAMTAIGYEEQARGGDCKICELPYRFPVRQLGDVPLAPVPAFLLVLVDVEPSSFFAS